MKKILIICVAAILILFTVLYFSFNGMVKSGVETVGSKVAKVPVKLQAVSLSPLSGSGHLKGLIIGNPDGFKTEAAIKMGAISAKIQPRSIFSGEVIFDEIVIESPEITWEGDLGASNLTKIQKNLQGPDNSSSAKKIQIARLRITNGKINLSNPLLGGKSIPIALPDIEITDIGKNKGGVTPRELFQEIFKSVMEKSTFSVGQGISELGKSAGEVGSQVEKLGNGLKGLFK